MTADNPAAPDVPGAGPVAAVEAIRVYLRLYTLPANVKAYLSAEDDHDSVAERCAPLLAEHLAAANLLTDPADRERLDRLVPCSRCGTRTVYRERVGDLTCCDTCAVAVGAEEALEEVERRLIQCGFYGEYGEPISIVRAVRGTAEPATEVRDGGE